MKKLIFSLCAVVMVVLSGCSKYDDGPLSDRVDNLEKRVTTLEELCKQMNTNISSLQTLVSALQQNDVITSIKPVNEGSDVIGYSISFTKSPAITIYHGKDGQDGSNGSDGKDGVNPVIGVKPDADGHYYWTLNGEWILGTDGSKIRANGTSGENGNDGQDGITPKFKIDEGNWYISNDNGLTWENLGRATGADGNSGDSMFSSIDTSKSDNVTFTLSNGTKFTLPRQAELTITFDETGLIAMKPNTTRTLEYTISGNTAGLHVEVLSSGNVRAKVSDNSSATGTLTVITGATVDEYDKVVLLASNGQVTIMSSISFEEQDCLRVTNGTTFNVSSAGGTIDINIETNTEYTLSIPDNAKSWISIVTSRAMRQETITLNVKANDGDARKSTLALVNKDGVSCVEISVSQKAPDGYIPSDMTIAFPDEEFRKYVLENFDTNKDGVISKDEALNVTDIRYPSATSLEGIQYFSELKYLYCNGLNTLNISGLSNLEELNAEAGEGYGHRLTALDLSGCISLKTLKVNGNLLKDLDISDCTNLEIIDSSYNLLNTIDLSNCKKLRQLFISSNYFTTLDLSNCHNLYSLYCYNNNITTLDLNDCYNLEDLRCFKNSLTTLNVNNNPKLHLLICSYNKLTSLNLDGCIELQDLQCDHNKLTTLDVSSCTKLNWLNCSSNLLSTLDVSMTDILQNRLTNVLNCSLMPTLETLYLKTGWSITGITNSRDVNCIPEQTKIIFVD